MANRIVDLPSGAKLEIQPAEFRVSKALYATIAAEAKMLPVDPQKIEGFLKDIFCVGLSSPLVDKAIWDCFPRCLYNGKKIGEDTFEPVELRQDYLPACFEVAVENVSPFTKGLYAKYGNLIQKIKGFLA